jgi:hypothetical protein
MQFMPYPSCRATVRDDGITDLGACPSCGESLVVDDRFRLQELLGQGGTAVVYGGREERTGRKVAIKVLDHAPDYESVALFEHGARVLEGLDHPGLPRVYACTEDRAGRRVLVREAFDGGTLEERVNAQQRRLAPLTFRRLLESLLRIVASLHGLVPPAGAAKARGGEQVELDARDGAVVDLEVGRGAGPVAVIEEVQRGEVHLPVAVLDRLGVVGEVGRAGGRGGGEEEEGEQQAVPDHPFWISSRHAGVSASEEQGELHPVHFDTPAAHC